MLVQMDAINVAIPNMAIPNMIIDNNTTAVNAGTMRKRAIRNMPVISGNEFYSKEVVGAMVVVIAEIEEAEDMVEATIIETEETAALLLR